MVFETFKFLLVLKMSHKSSDESEEIDYPETEVEEEEETKPKRRKISDESKELKKDLVRRKKLQEHYRQKRLRKKNNLEKRLGKLSLKD